MKAPDETGGATSFFANARSRRQRLAAKETAEYFTAIAQRTLDIEAAVVLSSRVDEPSEPRFDLGALLGEGAMGAVYAATDRWSGTPIAVKRVKGESGHNKLRLKREFRALRDLGHPNLVQLLDLFEEDELLFFSMELVEGVDFMRWIRAVGGPVRHTAPSNRAAVAPTMTDGVDRLPLPDSRARFKAPVDLDRLRDSLRQLTLGLRALHDAGMVHCDVKPSNVLVTDQGRVVVLDLGLVANNHDSRPWLAGTVSYMAPEQAAGGQLSPAADWYSVGVMLYVALTNHLPFSGDSADVLKRKQEQPPPHPTTLNATAPSGLANLCMGLLRRDAAFRFCGDDVLHLLDADVGCAVPEPTAPSEFVGRADEVATLLDACLATASDLGILVEGEAGIGKSALARECFRRLREMPNSPVVLRGRCHEHESVSYKAFDGVFDDLARVLVGPTPPHLDGISDDRLTVLRSAFPALQRVPRVAAAKASETTARTDRRLRRQLLLAALRQLFEVLCSQRRVVVWLDDLQWVDADSVALIQELRRAPNAPPVTTVVAQRPADEPTARVFALFRVLRLGPLTDAEGAQLARRLARSDSGENAIAIAREAGGHPLFIETLAKHPASFTGRTSVRLHDALGEQFRALSNDSQQVLCLVSVSRAPVARAVVSVASGLDVDRLGRALALLRQGSLIGVATHNADELEPYHDLVRKAVLASMQAAEIRNLHGQLAKALSALRPDAHEQLAVHHEHAGERATAAQHYLAAARSAEDAYAFDRSVDLYRRVLSLTGVPLEDPNGFELRLKLADALKNAGRGAEAAVDYLRIAELVPDPARRLELTRLGAEQLLRSGRYEEGLAAAKDVLRQAGIRVPKGAVRTAAAVAVARAKLVARGFEVKRGCAPDARRLGQNELRLGMGFAVATTDVGLAAAMSGAALLESLDLGDPRDLARCLAFEANAQSVFTGFTRRSASLLDTALELAKEAGDAPTRAWVYHWIASAAFSDDQFGTALDLVRRAQTTLRDQGPSQFSLEQAGTWAIELWSLYHLGRLNEARARLSIVRRDAEQRHDLLALALIRTGFGNTIEWLADDRPAKALADTRGFLGGLSPGSFNLSNLFGLLAQLRADLYQQDFATASARLRGSRRQVRRLMTAGARPVRRWLLDVSGHCHVAASFGDDRAMERHLRAAGAAARKLRRITAGATESPLSLLLDAGIAHRRGQRLNAQDHYRRAAIGFGRLDMLGHQAVARRRQGQTLEGDLGQSLIDEADATMIRLGIANPARWAMMLAPIRSPETR